MVLAANKNFPNPTKSFPNSLVGFIDLGSNSPIVSSPALTASKTDSILAALKGAVIANPPTPAVIATLAVPFIISCGVALYGFCTSVGLIPCGRNPKSPNPSGVATRGISILGLVHMVFALFHNDVDCRPKNLSTSA